MLDLGFQGFDQSQKGGWRSLANKRGCGSKAADLVRDYRQRYEALIPLLYWHEGQLRVEAGEIEQAIALMQASQSLSDTDRYGWNAYVDATIAFLHHDRSKFLQARAHLYKTGKPSDWASNLEWPQNFSVVEGLWHCFDKPYKIAYSLSCRPKK